MTAVLPETYIPDPMQRLALYQRMAEGDNDEAVFDVLAEIEDRYGPLPDEVRHLAEVMVIRRRLKRLGVLALSVAADGARVLLGLGFAPQPWVRMEVFYTRVDQTSLRAGGRLYRNRVGFQIVTSKPVRVS